MKNQTRQFIEAFWQLCFWFRTRILLPNLSDNRILPNNIRLEQNIKHYN